MHVLYKSLTTLSLFASFPFLYCFLALNESCCPDQSVQLHMQLLVHASQCTRTTCQSQNCAKMKALLKHGASCNLRAARGCQICRRIWALLQIHARHCKTQNKCPVPRCRDLKDHLRQLRYAAFVPLACWFCGSYGLWFICSSSWSVVDTPLPISPALVHTCTSLHYPN